MQPKVSKPPRWIQAMVRRHLIGSYSASPLVHEPNRRSVFPLARQHGPTRYQSHRGIYDAEPLVAEIPARVYRLGDCRLASGLMLEPVVGLIPR